MREVRGSVSATGLFREFASVGLDQTRRGFAEKASGPSILPPANSLSCSFDELDEALGIVRGGCFLIVVEVAIDGQPASSPAGDGFGPALEGLFWIAVFVLAGRTVSADVNAPGRHFPGSGRVMMVGQAQRDTVLPQQLENLRFKPARIAELERIAALFVQ